MEEARKKKSEPGVEPGTRTGGLMGEGSVSVEFEVVVRKKKEKKKGKKDFFFFSAAESQLLHWLVGWFGWNWILSTPHK